MAQILFANYVSTTLANALTAVQVQMVVNSVAGFPTLVSVGDYYYLTLIDQVSAASGALPPAQREIVKVTAAAGTTLTIVRAQDDTVAQNWLALSVVELRFNAQAARDISTGGLTVPITIPNGGTGQITQQLAINALTNVAAATAGQSLVRDGLGNATFFSVESEYNVKLFGAVGDGVTNDTAAIAGAIASASANNRGVYFPQGTYVTSPIVVGPNVAYLRGDGPAVSIIWPIRAVYGGLTSMVNFNNCVNSPGMYDLGLNVDDATFSNCWGVYFGAERFTARNCRIVGQLTGGFIAQSSASMLIQRCRFFGTGVGGLQVGVGTSGTASAVTVEGCWFEGVFHYGVNIGSGSFNRILNNVAAGSLNFTFTLSLCTHSTIDGNYSSDSQFESFQITDSQFCAITNNRGTWGVLGQDFGISVAGGTVECKFCIVANNTLSNSYKAGIALAFTTTNCLVYGNNLHNCAVREQLAVGPTAMIGLYTEAAAQLCAYNRVQNNTLWSDTTPISYGISEIQFGGSPVDNNFFDNNQIFNAIAAFPYLVVGASTSVAEAVWRTWVPVVTNSAGGGVFTVDRARYQRNGKQVSFVFKCTVTNAGAGGFVSATLPFTPVAIGGACSGIETAVVGSVIAGSITAAGIFQLRVFNTTATCVLNYQLVVSGTYEMA